MLFPVRKLRPKQRNVRRCYVINPLQQERDRQRHNDGLMRKLSRKAYHYPRRSVIGLSVNNLGNCEVCANNVDEDGGDVAQ